MSTERARVALMISVVVLATACPGTTDGPDGGIGSDMDSAVDVDEDGRPPPLVCPGARGCVTADGALKVGAAARAITPVFEPWTDTDGDGVRDFDEPFEDVDGDGAFDAVWMAGFSMGRLAQGVHDELWARALVVEKGETRVGLVALDLIGYFTDDVIAIRTAARAAGLDLDHVVVTSTHQHEGPDTMGLWGPDPSTTGYDPAYIATVVAAAVDALGAAVQRLREARLTVGRVDAPTLVADSRDPVVIDPSITTLAFDGVDDGAREATMVVFGNHPEALSGDNVQVTSDYPHFLREAVEATHPGSTALFFAGTLGGLMNPLGVIGCPDDQGQATCGNGSFEKAAYLGDNVAALALASLTDDGAHTDDAPALALRRLPVLVPGTNEVFVLGFKLGLVTRDVFTLDGERIPAERARSLELAELLEMGFAVATEVNALTIGPVELVTIPGELYPELWLVGPNGERYVETPENADFPDAEPETPIMARMPEAPFRVCLNNANDALGYIIPKPQFDFSSPYAYDPDGQYGEQNSIGEEGAPTITEAFDALYALEP